VKLAEGGLDKPPLFHHAEGDGAVEPGEGGLALELRAGFGGIQSSFGLLRHISFQPGACLGNLSQG
jgi:hypothetical protein